MGLRQCENCSEFADEAKAFCPGCGQAFVEELERTQSSNFDAMDNTVQFGQTMYNQMLSDMGLNISKTPDVAEQKVETLAPVGTSSQPKLEDLPKETVGSANSRKWLYIALTLIVLMAIALFVIAVGVFVYFYRIQ